jgi:hypothetical protein
MKESMDEQAYHAAVIATLKQADKGLSLLPHPARLKAISELIGTSVADEVTRAIHVWSGLCESVELGRQAVEMLRNPAIGIATFLEVMTTRSSAFRSLVLRMSHDGANANFGNVEGMVIDSRQRLLEWPVFQTRNTLEQRLVLTDIGADMPCQFFRLPYDRIFLECGETRSSPLRIHNAQSGEHVFEGAYLEQFSQVLKGVPVRVVYIMLIGSPVGKAHLADDAYYTLSVIFEDDEDSLETVLNRVFEHTHETVRENASILPTGHFRDFGEKDRAAIRAAVFHVAKVLLYLNSQDARTESLKERSTLAKQLAGLRGGGKISKVQRKLHKAYDRILVGTPNLPKLDASAALGAIQTGQKSAHWRRGHFRNQAYGPSWSLHRAVYIEPVLVHGELESAAPSRKTYKIGN